MTVGERPIEELTHRLLAFLLCGGGFQFPFAVVVIGSPVDTAYVPVRGVLLAQKNLTIPRATLVAVASVVAAPHPRHRILYRHRLTLLG